MNVHLSKDGDSYGMDFSATLDRLMVVENGEETIFHESGIPKEEIPAGVFGYDAYEAEFSFSQALAGPFSVEIENWDRTSSYRITQDESGDTFVVPLPSYSAHYRVYADFSGDKGTIYKAEFRFEIETADN